MHTYIMYYVTCFNNNYSFLRVMGLSKKLIVYLCSDISMFSKIKFKNLYYFHVNGKKEVFVIM